MKQIATALVKAQKAFEPARKQSNNPAYRSKYASLENCIDAVLEALNANGIMFCQPCHECNDGVIIETLFIHESGEMFSAGKLHVPAAKQDPQGYGSALTYARRYSLLAACGIAPEDDDGNAAAAAVYTPPKAAPKTKELTAEQLDAVLTEIDFCANVETLTAICGEAKKKCSAQQLSVIVQAFKAREKAIVAAPVQAVFPGATVEP